MRHYAAESVETRQKEDHSPVTAADEDAEAFILKELVRIAPGVPIIAEEEAAAGRIQTIGLRASFSSIRWTGPRSSSIATASSR